MRPRTVSLTFAAIVATSFAFGGCAADSAEEALPGEAPPASTVAEAEQPAPSTEPDVTPKPGIAAPKPADDPGPAPAGCGTVTKDKNGFFTRTTGKSAYVGFVPKSYAGKPTTLVVGLHGCGDNAMNFATWAVNPMKTRLTQSHIGISIGGKDGACWNTTDDVEKVKAAIEDVSKCFYVHQQKVVLAGYSSGGILAYKMGLSQSASFAGILIENSGLGGAQPSGAAWKINVAHIAHKGDSAFPIAKVRADWAKLEAGGIPLQKSEVEGDHNGTSGDWSDYLLPKASAWKAP